MYKEALQLERDLGNESMQAICLNNIGSVYSNKGQYEDALTYFQQALQLREKSKVPQDIVEAVHNLGYTSTDMGQYDQAISYYMRALDLRRSMDDQRGAAIESYSLGTLFDYQGRFGAAINSKQDALKTFREIKDKTFWMAKMLGGMAEALILAGRGDEAKSYLDEALSLSRELKNDGMVAETLGGPGRYVLLRGRFQIRACLLCAGTAGRHSQQRAGHDSDCESQPGQGPGSGKTHPGSHFQPAATDSAGRRPRAEVRLGRVLDLPWRKP